MIENTIIYEQPLNELIRVCLRLEQLFHQLDYLVADTSTLGTRHVVSAVIQILQLLDRPDLKAKLAKELGHHLSNLMRLENTPQIDQEKLRQLLRQLDDLIRCFIDSNGKIGQNLRDVEMLNNLRLHLTSPGGGCNFDIPVFHYWLQQPIEKRQETINAWLKEFSNIRTTATLILQLIREGTKVQHKMADHGFCQELLDPQLNLRLIRVAIPQNLPVYPEISVGRHFLSIRFFSPNITERATQYTDNLSFWLAFGS
ncbi:MAG: cell division protein ZapD [Gammaproteobacteria bacterium]|nr:cell division protein ZapD [Gammaproteobacteria bacterium]